VIDAEGKMMMTLVRLTIVLVLVLGGAVADGEDLESSHLAHDVLPYPPPPYSFDGSRYLGVAFATTPEALRALVPEPLEPNERGLIHLLVAEQRVVHPVAGTYFEAMLSIPVSLGGTAGSYMPVLYLDEVVPILSGREVYGFAKVEADIRWETNGDSVHITVARRGATLIRLAAVAGEPVDQIPQEPQLPIFNLKLVPSVELDAPPDVRQLTATTLEELVVTQMRPAVAELELSSSGTDPLGAIPVLSVIGAAYSERSFVLPDGRVVLDYLEP
jgi:acetoacetate decarboxylase